MPGFWFSDMTARIWHGKVKLRLVEVRGHRGAIHSLDWDPTNPNVLVTASKDRTIVWDSRQRAGRS